jgi:outer membrane biosynthesis protein TonB
MAESSDLRTLLTAAEQAAASGDYAAAETLLREVAAIQEASLGSQHPDLANTLNNLGIVSEIVGKPEDAEQFFRRACAIAATSLEPSHPFVATSRKNLEDFCEARGKPVDVEAPAPVDAAPPVVQEPTPRVEIPEPPIPPTAIVEPPPPGMGLRRLVFPVAAAVVLLVVAMAIWLRPGDPGTRSGTINPTPPPETSPPTPAPAPATSATPNPPPVSKPIPSRSSEPASTGAVSVTEVAICRELTTGSRWRCTPAVSPVEPSTLFFYTRVKSATDRVVEHRWYRGNHLMKSIDRPVRANPTDGYRTYSRTTVDANGGGDWRVELKTKDGTLIHEERFTVR